MIDNINCKYRRLSGRRYSFIFKDNKNKDNKNKDKKDGHCSSGTELVKRIINRDFTTEIKITTEGNSMTPRNSKNASNNVGTGLYIIKFGEHTEGAYG